MELPDITQARSQPVGTVQNYHHHNGTMHNYQYNNGHGYPNSATTLNRSNYMQTTNMFQTTEFYNQSNSLDDNDSDSETDEEQSDSLLGQNNHRNRTITTGNWFQKTHSRAHSSYLFSLGTAGSGYTQISELISR